MFGKVISVQCPKCNAEFNEELGVTQYYKFRSNDGKARDVRVDTCSNCNCEFVVADDGFCIVMPNDAELVPSIRVCY